MDNMSYEMVRAYVQDALKKAEALSLGVMRGITANAGDDGHNHRFAVFYDEKTNKFVGETSVDGDAPHSHYILVDVSRVLYPSTGDTNPQPRAEEDHKGSLVADIPARNTPEALRRLLAVHNQKEMTLPTMNPYHGKDEAHTHALTLRFAGHMDERPMARMEAQTIFGKSLEKASKEHNRLDAAKKRASDALEQFRSRMAEAVKDKKKYKKERGEKDKDKMMSAEEEMDEYISGLMNKDKEEC